MAGSRPAHYDAGIDTKCNVGFLCTNLRTVILSGCHFPRRNTGDFMDEQRRSIWYFQPSQILRLRPVCVKTPFTVRLGLTPRWHWKQQRRPGFFSAGRRLITNRRYTGYAGTYHSPRSVVSATGLRRMSNNADWPPATARKPRSIALRTSDGSSTFSP